MAIRQYFTGARPNISIDINREVNGQLVAPQKMLTIPQAAHKPTGRPNIGARKLPNVAPTNKAGTISPPLYPPPRVAAVNTIFKMKTYHAQLVKKLAIMMSPPAPR